MLLLYLEVQKSKVYLNISKKIQSKMFIYGARTKKKESKRNAS